MDAEKTMFAGSDQATYNSISRSEQQPVSKSRNGSRNKLGSRMGSEADLLSASNIDSLERAFRRKNFAELPFMSTFGMTTRESAIKKTMSMEGISSLGIEAQYTEEVWRYFTFFIPLGLNVQLLYTIFFQNRMSQLHLLRSRKMK